jgi:zinc D-Ala-D-Ala dipeptidase
VYLTQIVLLCYVKIIVKFIVILIALLNSAPKNGIAQTTAADTILPKYLRTGEWKEIAPAYKKQVVMKMAYATKDNFLKQKIYPCATCLLRPEAMQALYCAIDSAKKLGYKLVIFDCYRPQTMQQKMFDIMPDTKYVADPKKGSMHNRGLALDIGLADANGKLLNCGSAFDDFTSKAHFANTNCSKNAIENKTALRKIMTSCGFEPYDNEWWHFSYKKVKYDTASFEWNCN